MKQRAIVSAEQVTPAWLTAVLHSQGSLPRGRVIAVTAGPGQATFGSSVWRLQVRYSPDAAPDAPLRLFLKVSNPALTRGRLDVQQLEQEVSFYSTMNRHSTRR